MISIEVDDSRVIARLDAMPEKVRAALQRKRNALVLQLLAKAQGNAPVGPNSPTHTGGQLRRSIRSRTEDTAISVTGFVATGKDTPYARIQELGGKTAAHDILPVKAKALHFVGKFGMYGATEVFAKIVHHPGSKIHPLFYMRRSLKEMAPAIDAGFREAVVEGTQS